MNERHLTSPTQAPAWVILLVAVLIVVLVTAVLGVFLASRQAPATVVGSMMSGSGGSSMMGGRVPVAARDPQPGEAGFVAGTPATPRVVRVVAGPGYTFSPSSIAIARGETVTFVVTAMGPAVHEFMVGPADAVAADLSGTPEVADIAMMRSKSLTYTFDGSGPYGFACHAEGHYEAGMHGTVSIVG